MTKRPKFLDAALHLRRVLDQIETTYAFAYGTALGFHREGDFLEHDKDIDIAISPKQNTHGRLEVLRALHADPEIMIVRSGGALDDGLNIRALVFGIKIDFDFFYPSDASSSWWWSTSYSEDKHPGFRYRWLVRPFEPELLCIANHNFRTVPTSFLDDSYENWRIPIRFSYLGGIENQLYKGAIKEPWSNHQNDDLMDVEKIAHLFSLPK